MWDFESLIDHVEQDILDQDYRDYEQYDNLWDDDWPEPSIEDYKRWEREYQEEVEDNPWFGIWCGNIAGGKLESFLKDTNQFKSFDPKFIHPDVARRKANYDPIHKFCHNKGYRSADKIIEKIIAKLAKNGGSAASSIVVKIKSRSEYKYDNTFRSAAKRYIEALENPNGGYLDMTNWNWCMSQYVYFEGHVMDKPNAKKYWGYTEICKICGADHGN